MKEAEKIINSSEEWVNENQKNRTAVVILANNKKEDEMWTYIDGATRDIEHLICSLMAKNKELGYNIYVAACLYAHRHITAEERDKINAVISAVAEERKKIEAIIFARKKPKGGEE